MSLAQDILLTYRHPAEVIDRRTVGAPREDRAIALVMGACALMFAAQLPKLSRQAHLTGEDLNILLGASLMGLIFVAPLLCYLLAFVTFGISRVFGGRGSAFQHRMALFWSLLAAAPLALLNGLVAGFVGAGPQLTIVGAFWFAAFMWFWSSGLWQISRKAAV